MTSFRAREGRTCKALWNGPACSPGWRKVLLYIDEHKCRGGAAVMGLAEIPENVANGDYYYKLGAFAQMRLQGIPWIQSPRIEKTFKICNYSPLGSANFSPDMVVVLCTPKQAMQLVQADLYTDGGCIQTGFAGKQSLCGDIVANTLNTNSVQVSLGCSGSRKHAKIDDNELIVGIHWRRSGSLWIHWKAFWRMMSVIFFGVVKSIGELATEMRRCE